MNQGVTNNCTVVFEHQNIKNAMNKPRTYNNEQILNRKFTVLHYLTIADISLTLHSPTRTVTEK